MISFLHLKFIIFVWFLVAWKLRLHDMAIFSVKKYFSEKQKVSFLWEVASSSNKSFFHFSFSMARKSPLLHFRFCYLSMLVQIVHIKAIHVICWKTSWNTKYSIPNSWFFDGRNTKIYLSFDYNIISQNAGQLKSINVYHCHFNFANTNVIF